MFFKHNFLSLKVTVLHFLQKWATDLKAKFGTLDFAFIVAGVVDGYAGLTDTNAEKMLFCFKTNTIGPLLVAQALVKNGVLQQGSTLVNLTSKVGRVSTLLLNKISMR